MGHLPVVLVVEDDIYISRLIAVLLEDGDYQPMTAGTAAEAVARIEQDKPDLVILDWMLPDMPGDEVCRLIKQRATDAFLPVLMLTARSEPADRVAGLDAGADDYMTKPFHGDELLARARALLRIRVAEIARAETLAVLHRQHEELKAAYEQLRSTQAQLVQASKLASLGELVAGVAHELNNPLAIILGNAELLPALDNAEDQRSIRQIIDAAQRGRRVLQSLVTFARHGNVEADWHNPRDLVERVLDLKRTTLQTAGIALEVTYAPDLPMLYGDGPQIQQALLNLLVNAEQALAGHERPRLVIHAYSATEPVKPPAALPDLTPAACAPAGERRVVFDLADNGPGLAPQILGRLFEPYVTTRPVGQGAGMGLAIAYGIVQQHGGSLQVASEPGCGVTFRMALPADRRLERRESPGDRTSQGLSTGRVLVIDDEPAIVDMVTRLLLRSGYTVVGVNQAVAGLEELQRQPFDTILCDIRMPDMDGVTFHRRLHATQLDHLPRLVVMTGDTSTIRIDEFLRHHNLPILRKPFTRQDLLEVVTAAQ